MSDAAPTPRRRRRVLVAALAPLLFLVVLEGLLALLGVGDPKPFFVRDPNDPAKLARSPNYREFFATPPAPFLAAKPANGFRVVVIGESTVAGYPFFYATFCDWLAAELSDLLPGRACEVINAGVVGWTSFRLLAILDECLRLKPDVVIWMVGHNEERAADNVLRLRQRHAHPWRAAVGDALAGTRIARWFGSLHNLGILQFPAEEGREVPRVREEGELLRENFRSNLARMSAAVRAAGARLVLTTMPLDARDLPPSGSRVDPQRSPADRERVAAAIRDGQAAFGKRDVAATLAYAEAALAIDPTPADAHFLRAKALEVLGRCEEARASFDEAMERDLWPSRARRWVQDAIREEAKRSGAVLVDLKKEFDAHGKCGVAGREWLCDDVHPNLPGHRAISGFLVAALADANIPIPKGEWAWTARRTDEEIRRSFGTAETEAFAAARAEGYLRLFEAFTLPESEAPERRAKAVQARTSLEQAHRLVLQDVRVEVLLATAEIEAGEPTAGASRLREALGRDRGVAFEFARIVETSPTMQKHLGDAGVALAELRRLASR